MLPASGSISQMTLGWHEWLLLPALRPGWLLPAHGCHLLSEASHHLLDFLMLTSRTVLRKLRRYNVSHTKHQDSRTRMENLISGMHQSLDQKHKNSLIHLLGSSRRYLQFHVKVCTLKAWYLLIFITLHIGRKWSQEQQSKTVLHSARKQQMPLWQKHPQSPFSFTNSCVHYSHTHQRHQRAAATKHWKEGWAHPLCSTELKPSQNGGCKFGRLCKTFINLTELSSPRMLLRWNILGKQLLLEHK